ncbi:MAG: hypothetical protein LBS87_02695, partial [Puniceicoccales bacterium]|nr:hypothetical protein [Puniceicoccales bacterium]
MSEISKVSIIYPDGVSISTAGQYLENPFFQVPVGSTFAFLYDTNTTLSQAVLKQMYETILASQGGDMSGELRKAYEAAVKALNDMPGELAKCNADLASINAYENANVPALLASTIAILDTMESAITGLSDNLFSQTWKKTDIINDIGTIRSYLGTHYPNLNDDDFKDIFTRINGIRTIIAEVTRPDAGSDKYIELVFPLLGFDRSYIGSGDAGQSLLTIGEIREWIDGINGDPGILSPFISAFKAAMAVDKAINPAHITNFKSAIQAQMTMSYPWDANDRNGEGVTLTISGPYNIYTYQKTITVEYAGGYGTATRVYDVAEYYVRNADGSDGDRYEDLCNAIGLGDIAHTYNDSLLFEGIISSISSSPYANPIRTIQDDLIEIIFNRLNGDNSDEAKAAKLAILQAKDMPGASNYNLLSARKEKLFGFSSVLANLGTVETNVNSLKTNLSLADTIQKLKDKYYIPLNSTLDALKAAINAKIAGLDESKLQANVALAKAKVDEAMKGKAESLLQLALRYNPPSGQGFLVTGVSKTIDANGNATYKAKINGDTNEDGTISLAEAQAATVVTSKTKIDNVANHLSIPYFALAMCYEMTCVVKDMLLA